MTTALVTRPAEDAATLTEALAARGIGVFLEPMLAIAVHAAAPLDLAGVQGFLATSANGVRALAAACPERALPLWAVGDATARAARHLGFSRVESAHGDAAALTALVAQRADPAAGSLLHAAGTVVAGDISTALTAQGFRVRREILYEARAITALSPALCAALNRQEIELALFFSPRTAATFVTLAKAAGLKDSCAAVTAHALSPAVAERLQALPWRAVVTAAQPTQEALLAGLERFQHSWTRGKP
ncbi:uroporphyrinogen-III synthase [mine drainage metagenome]|uniref:Uroporphyrinogen-III synthase n=1 Tax=mine drainage metagenome TaxID=410659 RepID=A0A1J5SGE5_9ZZZZ